MKVLHVINNLSTGGAERLLTDLLPVLNLKTQIDVSLLLLSCSESSFKQFLQERHPEITIYQLKFKTPYNPLIVWRLRPFLKKFDVIHVHLLPSLYWVVFAKLISKGGAPLFYTEHCPIQSKRKGFLFRWVDTYVYSKLEKVIAISEATASSVKKHLSDISPQVITIPNGIFLDRYLQESLTRRSDFNLNKSDFLIIQVSNFNPAKDQNTVIRALSLLPEHHKLLLVGEGPKKPASENLAKKMGLANRIHFLGSRADIPQLLSMADVVVLSSHFEGFGLAALEGMAAGKPVLASDVPGLEALVRNAGLLFPKGDEEQLKSHLLRLDQDRSFYNKVRKACIARSKNFSVEEMAIKLINLYKQEQ